MNIILNKIIFKRCRNFF